MTDERRFDRTARTWLESGPTRAPDRVVLAALRTIESTPQERDLWIPRRFSVMTIRIAAVVAVVALIGGGAMLLFGGHPSPIGGLPSATPFLASPPPSPSAATPSPAATASPSASLGASSQDPSGTLAVGTTYTVTDASFSQPLTFTVNPGFPSTTPAFAADPWPSRDTLRLFSYGHYALTIHDDAPISKDLCKPGGAILSDIPATPTAVGTWLQSSSHTTVSKATDMTVNGRPAKRWDVTFGAACGYGSATPPPGPGPVVYMNPGETHRFYAVSTGTDTILVITWVIDVDAKAVNAASDLLVGSMTFR